MVSVAAVDCGTNSIRLLVADVDAVTGRQRDYVRRMTVVRLGQGVDATGELAPEALERTLAAVDDFAAVVAEHDAVATRFVATSAMRDARNSDLLDDGVKARLGVTPEVVSGAEEAALSFTGATRELAGRYPGPFLVVDIGGGSTEVVLGETAGGTAGETAGGTAGEPGSETSGRTVGRAVGGAGGQAASELGASPSTRVLASRSVDVGCVRLTERHLRADPPTPAQVAAARADVERALDEIEQVVPLDSLGTVVGLAGSVTSVAAETLGLSSYDPGAIHESEHDLADVTAACSRLLAAPRAERAARGFMHPGRVDVIGGGALIWLALLERLQLRGGLERVLVSEHDILDGIAWSLA